MGLVVEGQWVSDEASASGKDGRWARTPTRVHGWVRADGSTPHSPEAGRYHLWLAWNCTWSQRTMITANLLGLDHALSWSMAHWHRNEGGWWFNAGLDGLQPDELQVREGWSRELGFHPHPGEQGLSLWKIYVAGDPSYSGRATVPLLWDRKLGRAVNNESQQILRMLQGEFGALQKTPVDLLPAALREDIEQTNAWVYEGINDGVYRVGFAGTQAAYEEALDALFGALDRVEQRLRVQRYLVGDCLTEADVRLFPTLIRFDPVYYGHFKCNLRRIADYPALSNYLRDLYQTPGFAQTVRVDLYKLGYMGRSQRLNPSRIIPRGPQMKLDAPHDRDRLGPRRFEPRALD